MHPSTSSIAALHRLCLLVSLAAFIFFTYLMLSHNRLAQSQPPDSGWGQRGFSQQVCGLGTQTSVSPMAESVTATLGDNESNGMV